MKKMSSIEESKVVDGIKEVLDKCEKGKTPSEAVAEVSMQRGFNIEKASRVCEAVNKITSIKYLADAKPEDRGKSFPLANADEVRSIMNDSTKVANKPFQFRKTASEGLPLMSRKEAAAAIFNPTEAERNTLRNSTLKAEISAAYEERRGIRESLKLASEGAAQLNLMAEEKFVDLVNKLANLTASDMDNAARYATWTYGLDGQKFLTALENLTGDKYNKNVRPYVKTGSDIERDIDMFMALTDQTKAVKLAAAKGGSGNGRDKKKENGSSKSGGHYIASFDELRSALFQYVKNNGREDPNNPLPPENTITDYKDLEKALKDHARLDIQVTPPNGNGQPKSKVVSPMEFIENFRKTYENKKTWEEQQPLDSRDVNTHNDAVKQRQYDELYDERERRIDYLNKRKDAIRHQKQDKLLKNHIALANGFKNTQNFEDFQRLRDESNKIRGDFRKSQDENRKLRSQTEAEEAEAKSHGKSREDFLADMQTTDERQRLDKEYKNQREYAHRKTVDKNSKHDAAKERGYSNATSLTNDIDTRSAKNKLTDTLDRLNKSEAESGASRQELIDYANRNGLATGGTDEEKVRAALNQQAREDADFQSRERSSRNRLREEKLSKSDIDYGARRAAAIAYSDAFNPNKGPLTAQQKVDWTRRHISRENEDLILNETAEKLNDRKDSLADRRSTREAFYDTLADYSRSNNLAGSGSSREDHVNAARKELARQAEDMNLRSRTRRYEDFNRDYSARERAAADMGASYGMSGSDFLDNLARDTQMSGYRSSVMSNENNEDLWNDRDKVRETARNNRSGSLFSSRTSESQARKRWEVENEINQAINRGELLHDSDIEKMKRERSDYTVLNDHEMLDAEKRMDAKFKRAHKGESFNAYMARAERSRQLEEAAKHTKAYRASMAMANGLQLVKDEAAVTGRSAVESANRSVSAGITALQKMDALRQALRGPDLSGNANANPILTPEAQGVINNMQLRHTFAKTYLSDPYLRQFDPNEVAEAFNIVQEVAPDLIAEGKQHMVGSMIRKYLTSSNQVDPLEIKDLTTTEKERVDTDLKREQLRRIKEGNNVRV